ncbi:MAG: ABC transporter permease [Cytophagaceae bacterium]|nr:ABC transporter permease [Gemmatimonadaceae bacterium]
MPELGRFARELRALLWKPDVRSEVSEEVSHHLDMLERDFLASGMTPSEARVAARARFGDPDSISGELRDLGESRDWHRRRREWQGEFKQDVRHAVRRLRMAPHFAVVAIATLGTGLGAATTIFAIANAVLLRPLPFAEADRLALAFERSPSGRDGPLAESNFLDWDTRLASFASLDAFSQRSTGFVADGEPEQLRGASATHGLFTTLGVAPVLGRTFLPDEGRRGGDVRVALVSHGLWLRRFGGAADVVGRSVELDGLAHRVVGVMPEGFGFPDRTDVWMPHVPDPAYPRDDRKVEGIGRLRPGVSLAQAQQELQRVAATLSSEHRENAGWSASLRPFRQWYVSPQLALRMQVLLCAVALLLAMACANVVNLLLVRVTARDREMAVRAALGAGRWRIVRQLLIEAGVLAGAGALAGTTLAALLLPVIRRTGSASIGRLSDLSLDGTVLAFAAAASIAAAFVFGLVPSMLFWRRARRSGGGGHQALRSGTRVADSGRAREALLVASLALATVLLVATGLVGASFQRLTSADMGFQPDHVVIASVALPANRYDAERIVGYVGVSLERLRGVPGVRAAGAANLLPFTGGNTAMDVIRAERAAEGRDRYHGTSWRTVTPGWFEAMRIPLLRGRAFGAEDRLYPGMDLATERSVIVNDVLAAATWPGEDPVGRRLTLVSGNTVTVVGVVGAARLLSPDSAAGPTMYFAHAQFPWRAMWITVRGEGDPGPLIDAVRRELSAIDPLVPIANLRTLASVVADAAAEPRLTTLIFAIFATAALLLVSVGLYGAISYSVTLRTREIGVSIALGASPGLVIRSILSSGARVGVAGIAIGGLLSFGVAGAMRSILYGTSPADPLSYAAAITVLLLVTLVASAIPAWRAARLDPVRALRSE